MGKVTKIVANVVASIVLGVGGLLLAVMLLLDVGTIQNELAKQGSRFASDYMHTKVSFSSINLTGYNRLSIRDFYVEDYEGDTLLYVRSAAARISLPSLLRSNIVLTNVKADSAKLLLHDEGNEVVNITEVTQPLIPKTKSENPKPITLRNLRLTNSEFRLVKDDRKPVGEGMIDWGNMRFEKLNAKANQLVIKGSRIEMGLHDINFTDRYSGAQFTDVSVELFAIDDGLLEFTNSDIQLPHTDLKLSTIKLSSPTGWEAWKSYVDSVTMDIKIAHSSIGAQDLSYFVDFVKRGQTFVLRDVTANLIGTTEDFRGTITNADVYHTKLKGHYHVSDVVKKPIRFDGEISELNTSAPDIEELAKQFGINIEPQQMAMISRLGAIDLKGKAEGELSDFSVDVDVNTDLGGVLAGAQISLDSGKLELHRATASADDFNVGFLTRNRELGKINFSASGTMNNYSANIADVEYNGYKYRNISATGSWEGNLINANVVSNDPSAKLTLKGSYKIDTIPQYDITADIERADLAAININKRDSISVVSAHLTASGSGLSLDDLMANAKIDDVKYTYSGGIYRAKDITISAANSSTEHSLSLQSEPLTAEYNSSADYRSSFGYLSDILYAFLPALPAESEETDKEHKQEAETKPENVQTPSHINLRIADVNPLLSAIAPGVSIARGTNITLDYDPSERNLNLAIASALLELQQGAGKEPIRLSNLVLTGESNGKDDSLHLNLTTGTALFGGLRINKVQGGFAILNNQADIHLTASSDQMSMATNLNGIIKLGRTEKGKLTISGEVESSTFSIDGQIWALASKQFDFLPDRIEIDDLKVTSSSGHLYINGALTNDRSDTLGVDIVNLNLEPLMRLMRVDSLDIKGMLNGKAEIYSLKDGILAEADITIDRASINGYNVTPLALHLDSDPKRKRNQFTISTQKTGKEFVRGYVSTIDGEYSARGGAHGIPLGIIQPFLGGAITSPEGEVDIDFDVTRLKGSQPTISGMVALRDIKTTVVFNNVSYSLPKATLMVSNSVATLPSTTITDSNGQSVKVTAKADFKNFANISYSANLQADNLLVLNTTYTPSSAFYGKLFVSGRVDMTGDMKGMNVNVIAETGSGSSFYLPMKSDKQVVNNDFVTFVSHDTATSADNNTSTKRNGNGTRTKPNINVDMTLTVRPNTEINLVLDPTTNEGIRATGDAVLMMKVAPKNDVFTLNGTYDISEGDYTLNIQNITSRRFAIQNGSTIQWSGVPLDPILNIRAVYSLRTSLSPLKDLIASGSNSQSFYARVPVDCIVNIGGKLSAPTIEPDIKVRVSDPQMESVIESAIAIQDVKLTQFAWLLAFGEFFTGGNVTNEDVNLTDVGLATVTTAGIGVITSEINNLINPDLGLRFNVGYHPRSDITSSEFIFGITKELTDRLTLQVSGDFDTGDNEAAASNVRQGTLIPDASLTWDISNNFNGRLFYRPIDQYNINTDKGTGEFGVGVAYRIDFNSFRELIDKISGKKKQTENNNQ